MNKIRNFLVLVMALAMASSAFGQATTPSTTFSNAVAYSDKVVYVTSATGMTGLSQGAFTTILFQDKEAMGVVSVSGTAITVQRGIDGTRQFAHNTSGTLWYGPPTYFSINVADPSGSCLSTNETALPRFFEMSGNGYTCPVSGPNKNQWTLQYPAPTTTAPTDNTLAGNSALQVCHATLSFAVDGGAISTITPKTNCVLPANAVIINSSINSTTAVTSAGSATVAFGLSAGGGTTTSLAGATAKASLGANVFVPGTPVPQTPSTWVKLTAAASVTATVATAALTAGIVEIYVWYFVSAT